MSKRVAEPSPAGRPSVARVRLDDVEEAEWDRLAGDDGFYVSHAWLRTVAHDPLARDSYACVRAHGRLAVALPVYEVEHEATERYAPERFARLFGRGSRFLVAGAHAAYRTTLLIDPELRGERRHEAVRAALAEALAQCAATACDGVVLPFLTTDALREVAAVVPATAVLDDVEADLAGCGSWAEYEALMNAHRRHAVRRQRERFERSGWEVRERSLGECVPRLAELLASVQRKYGHRVHERALETLLARQARELDARSLVLTCEDESGICAASLFYRWRAMLFGRLVGFDYPRLRGAFEYFNLAFYLPIASLGERGCDGIHFGPGSWEAKAFRAATIKPLWTVLLVPGDERPPGLELRNPGAVARRRRSLEQGGHRFDPEAWQP